MALKLVCRVQFYLTQGLPIALILRQSRFCLCLSSLDSRATFNSHLPVIPPTVSYKITISTLLLYHGPSLFLLTQLLQLLHPASDAPIRLLPILATLAVLSSRALHILAIRSLPTAI